MTLGPVVRVVIDDTRFRALVAVRTITVTATARYGLVPVEIALKVDPDSMVRAVLDGARRAAEPETAGPHSK